MIYIFQFHRYKLKSVPIKTISYIKIKEKKKTQQGRATQNKSVIQYIYNAKKIQFEIISNA